MNREMGFDINEGVLAPRRVLIVEDHALTRVLLEHTLIQAGFEAHAFATAEEAVRDFDNVDPDLLLSDIDLGGHPNGVALATILHARAPYLPVVLMSNYGSLNQVAGYRSLPKATRFVRKESIANATSLLSVIESALRASTHKRESQDEVADDFAVSSLRLLTKTQIEVLRFVAAGSSNQEIARRRNTSVGSIEKVLTRIFKALDFDTNPSVNPRVAAAKEFIRVFGPVHLERDQ